MRQTLTKSSVQVSVSFLDSDLGGDVCESNSSWTFAKFSITSLISLPYVSCTSLRSLSASLLTSCFSRHTLKSRRDVTISSLTAFLFLINSLIRLNELLRDSPEAEVAM